jgi:hypothetical protein
LTSYCPIRQIRLRLLRQTFFCDTIAYKEFAFRIAPPTAAATAILDVASKHLSAAIPKDSILARPSAREAPEGRENFRRYYDSAIVF